MDVEPVGPDHFVSPAFGETGRDVIEGGQLVGQAIVAASKSVPAQRVTSASLVFSRAASFRAPIDVHIDTLRVGKTFSSVSVRMEQDEMFRSGGIVLLDRGSDDLIRHAVAMPNVAPPEDSELVDMGVTGRELRVVDGAYTPDPDLIGPPELPVWCRFTDDPGPFHLHAALLSQSTTHWTIAAAMRPHRGFGEADVHVTLSTGIMHTTIAFLDDFDVTDWLLYDNHAIYAGKGLAQGDGRVFSSDGRLVANYGVQAMIRNFETDPASMGLDRTTAM